MTGVPAKAAVVTAILSEGWHFEKLPKVFHLQLEVLSFSFCSGDLISSPFLSVAEGGGGVCGHGATQPAWAVGCSARALW